MTRVTIAPRIVVDSEIRFGKPVIEGTRVPIALVLAELAGGHPISEIVEEYAISEQDVLAVLSYAAALVAEEEIRVRA